jgi:hypothetical protein
MGHNHESKANDRLSFHHKTSRENRSSNTSRRYLAYGELPPQDFWVKQKVHHFMEEAHDELVDHEF